MGDTNIFYTTIGLVVLAAIAIGYLLWCSKSSGQADT